MWGYKCFWKKKKRKGVIILNIKRALSWTVTCRERYKDGEGRSQVNNGEKKETPGRVKKKCKNVLRQGFVWCVL